MHFAFEERQGKNTYPLTCNAFEEWRTIESWKRSRGRAGGTTCLFSSGRAGNAIAVGDMTEHMPVALL